MWRRRKSLLPVRHATRRLPISYSATTRCLHVLSRTYASRPPDSTLILLPFSTPLASTHFCSRHLLPRSFSSAPVDHTFFQPADHTFIRAPPERTAAVHTSTKLAALGVPSEESPLEATAAISVVVNPWDDSYGYAGVDESSNGTRRGGTYIGGETMEPRLMMSHSFSPREP